MPREIRTEADLPEAKRQERAAGRKRTQARADLAKRKATGTVTRAEFNQLLDVLGIPEDQGNP